MVTSIVAKKTISRNPLRVEKSLRVASLLKPNFDIYFNTLSFKLSFLSRKSRVITNTKDMRPTISGMCIFYLLFLVLLPLGSVLLLLCSFCFCLTKFENLVTKDCTSCIILPAASACSPSTPGP